MKSLKSWLVKNGYTVSNIKIYNINGTGRDSDGLRIDTPYFGPYPGREQFDALEDVQRHVSRYFPELTVEPRGCHTAIFVY